MSASVIESAKAVLTANDRGGFTVPTAKLYPYQWNWDSAFAALGFSHFDRARAWQEIETLFEGQWSDGMVPHIIFRDDNPDYFPGPKIWQSGTTPPTSGHSQPPVAASVVLQLVESGDEHDLKRAGALLPKLIAYHNWFHTFRDPDRRGVIAVIHPWESGRDNCPDWDLGLNPIKVMDNLEAYQRRDTAHVDASQRPTMAQYDRFLTIVNFGRECGWDHEKIYRDGPFCMADPGVQFILLRADRDLLKLARLLEQEDAVAPVTEWIERAEKGSQYLWNEQVGGFCARDLRSDQFSDAITNASMLAFYAGAGTEEQRAALVANARDILDRVTYGFPSWDPRHPRFDPQRYWRGPVWAVMNYMIARGLEESGEAELAARLRHDTLRLTDEFGFYEYFNPLTGDGYGGGEFTWTAAIRLILSGEIRSSRVA